ncbi:MAG: hypothetical protein J0M37_08900 [Ignavibacteria bacterium]|nr:hypothetical protein [Ignavibacteria bacterium]
MRLFNCLIVLFFFIFLDFSLLSQEQENNNYKNLSSIPFRLGSEAGAIFNFNSNDKLVNPALLGFFDINLSKRNIFLKFEGGIFGQIKDKNSAAYVSAGLNYKIFNIKKNKFYLHGAVFAAWNKTGGGASFFLSFRHLYPFNKIIAWVSSIRYPFGRFDAVFLSTGFQLFAD